MKLFFPILFLFFLITSSTAQNTPEWAHFYGNAAPFRFSISENQVFMIGGKSLIHYKIDTEEIQDFNSVTHPQMPTNLWGNIWTDELSNSIWLSTNSLNIENLFPIYHHNLGSNNWVGVDLNDRFGAVFSYHKATISKGGKFYIPGLKTLLNGNTELVIATYTPGQDWDVQTIVTNPQGISKVVTLGFENFYIDTGETGIFTNVRGSIRNVFEYIEDVYTNHNQIIPDIEDEDNESVYLVNLNLDIVRIKPFNFGFQVEEYNTADSGLPENRLCHPSEIRLDKSGFFWGTNNHSDGERGFWRFKEGETTLVISFSSLGLQNGRILHIDKDSDLWIRENINLSSSILWKYGLTSGVKKVEIANTNMPLRGASPKDIIGDKGMIFTSSEGQKVLKNGDLEDIDLELGGEEGGLMWTLELPDNYLLYGQEGADRYFSQQRYSSEKQIFHYKKENGTFIIIDGILSVSPAGDLLAYQGSSPTFGQNYWLKKKDNDYWEEIEVRPTDTNGEAINIYNLIFADENRLFGMRGNILCWYDINTKQISTEDTAEDIFEIESIKSKTGEIWLINSEKVGKVTDDYPLLRKPEFFSIDPTEVLWDITSTKEGNVWISTARGRVFLWNDKEIIKEIHPDNSGLPFSASKMIVDANENLWMCALNRGCVAYRENGVNFDYSSPQPARNVDFGERLYVLSPNPVRDLLTIRSTFDMNSIKIYDALGREVTNLTMNAVNSLDINTSNWTNAIYFGTINSGINQQTFKFIKQ